MVSRRTIITVPIALAAAGLATGTALATARSGMGRRAVPKTVARSRTITGGRLRTRVEGRVTHLGVTWSGPEAIIATKSRGRWLTWTTSDICSGAPDPATAGHHALLVVPDTTEYEVVLASDRATGTVTELNTLDGPTIAAAAAPLAAMPLPDGSSCPVTYLPRSAWGADESLRFSGGTEVWPVDYAVTQALTVHHTAGTNNDSDPAGTIRAIYYYQAVTQAWGDIGYHLLIDEQGRVYEGRWSGSDPVPTFESTVAPGTAPPMVTAGHIAGYNTGNLGVCLLGNFTGQGPTAAAYDSLVTVLASLARVTGIDPEATLHYVGPTGATRTVLGVSGHLDWAPTECPGNTFYPTFPALRSAVADAMASPPLTMWPRPTPPHTRRTVPKSRP